MELPTVLGSQNVALCEEAAQAAAEMLAMYGAKLAIVGALGPIESSGKYLSVAFLGVWEDAGDGYKSRHYVVSGKLRDGSEERVSIYPARGARSRQLAGFAPCGHPPRAEGSALASVGEFLEHYMSTLSGVECVADPESWMRGLGDALLGPEESREWEAQRQKAALDGSAGEAIAVECSRRL
jgi:hypothetical protein